jgi:hypothetical protein
MRKLFSLLVLGAGLSLAQGAQAGALIFAQLQFQLATLPPASFTASGALGGSATGTAGGASWSVGAGAVPGGVFTTTLNTSASPPISQIQFIINGNPATGNFVASANGAMAVTGQANVKAYGGSTLLGVPVTVGTPSVITPPVAAGIGITAYANTWTTKTTTIEPTGVTNTVTATAMGSNGLVNGGGTVVLVSALNVLTSIAGQLPSFAILTLTYAADAVAEPGTLLLLGVGIAGLVGMGRRKAKK